MAGDNASEESGLAGYSNGGKRCLPVGVNSSQLVRIFLFIGALSILMGFFFWRSKKQVKAAQPSFQTTEELIAYLSEEARDIAKKSYAIDLDYTVESIKRVDEILGKLNLEYVKDNSKPGMRGLASAFGAYVGEVIRRHHQGTTWKQDHPTVGEKTYPIHWDGGESFPMAWCYKRIVNGEEDNVWHKYVVLKETRAGASPKDPPSKSD
jgi:hypothetical protein